MRTCRRFIRRRPPSGTAAIAVRERVLGVRVERADERQVAGRAERVPADGRHDRLVDVRDVVAALAQLVPQREDGVRA